MRRAESALVGSPQGNAPTLAAAATKEVLPCHPEFAATGAWVESKSCSFIAGRTPLRPKGTRAGPEARTRIVWEEGPAITKPAVIGIAVTTKERAERLERWEPVFDGSAS